ncbi:hypothetical protein HMPREF9374_1489 [Desmospora sp. 8437]|nr:hypothetical protein HMPREF9374_1489 [Desmospora sp. 8437]
MKVANPPPIWKRPHSKTGGIGRKQYILRRNKAIAVFLHN